MMRQAVLVTTRFIVNCRLILCVLVVCLATLACPLRGQISDDTIITPTWETQKQTRMYVLGIPAPRGQITDRHGEPFAVSRISYNLSVRFPVPLNFSEGAAIAYTRQQIGLAEGILQRPIAINDRRIVEHYRNRGLLPLEIVQDLKPRELDALQNNNYPGLELRPVYLRFYPQGPCGAHMIGYVGRMGKYSTKPIRNNELLWPEFEGRDGIEQTFNSQLTGSVGQMNLTFDSVGNKSSEVISIPPQAGHNVVTTLDLRFQQAAENILAEDTKRGSLVLLDPRNGDILAMASWPVYNPNTFVPFISSDQYQVLQEDPDIPLLPRAFRSSYPAGSIYKVITGVAALESGAIGRYDEFPCPPAFYLAGLTFRNWKDSHAGNLNFAEALTQSCNTWFYKVGIKTGKTAFIDWAQQFGMGAKTGIPLRAESSGRIPTDEYMERVYGRPILDGDMANMSIGQGDILVSPLQMAQLMMVVANGGSLYQLRLVSQVQDFNNKIVTGYNVRSRAQVNMRHETLVELNQGLYDVVHSGSGTAGRARVKGLQVCGKTGTAQWGPKRKEKTAAWFIGYAPRDEPRYAFAAIYEGGLNEDPHGGSHAAPLVSKLLKEVQKIETERQEAIEAAAAAQQAALKAEAEADANPETEADQQEPDRSG